MKKKKKVRNIILILIILILCLFAFLLINNKVSKKDNDKVETKTEKKDKTIIDEDETYEDSEEETNDNSSSTSNDNSIPKSENKENIDQNEAKNLNVSSIDLIGDEEITLNVGDKYTELGAKAYNTDGEDISNEIKIDSSVDTTKQGRYTVSYSIGNYIVLRYVIVK